MLLSVIYFKNMSYHHLYSYRGESSSKFNLFGDGGKTNAALFGLYSSDRAPTKKRRPFPMDEKDVSTYHGLAVVLVVVLVEHFSQS